MRDEQLIQVGRQLVRRFETRDPFAIADGLGIHVLFRDDFKSLKGMYAVILDRRFIFLNGDLDEHTLRIVCAHEIGHDQVHRDLAVRGAFGEYAIYDMRSRPEYEANLVAAEILLDTEEMLEYIRQNMTVDQIASAMGTDSNLVAIKVDQMAVRGYDVRIQEYRSDFLR